MRKGLSDFYARVAGLVSANERKAEVFIGAIYILGETIVSAIPAVQSGFINTVAGLTPDWHLLATSYSDRPLPVLATLVYYVSDIFILKNRFTLGQGFIALGASILTVDLLWHGTLFEAITYFPVVISGAFGAWREPLAKRYGGSANGIARKTLGCPNRMTGLFSVMGEGPTLISSFLAHDWALLIAVICWLIGSTTNGFLPEKVFAGASRSEASKITKSRF